MCIIASNLRHLYAARLRAKSIHPIIRSRQLARAETGPELSKIAHRQCSMLFAKAGSRCGKDLFERACASAWNCRRGTPACDLGPSLTGKQ